MSQANQADLDWLAFQYVNDELPADEAARFEERLAGDQAAREAVAEAMHLVQAVAAGARITTPASTGRNWLQHAAWSAIGAAVCLAVIFTLRALPKDAPVVQRPQAADLTSAELALVWAQNGSYRAEEAAEALAEDDAPLAADAREIERDFVVPAWMLEAVSGSPEIKPPVKESQES
jgi:hypothetical protein